MSQVLRLGPPFDPRLLDALSTRVGEWAGVAWRIVLRGSDPMVANSRGARWNPPEFEAIYSSLHRQGADAELDNILARQSVAIHRPRELYKFNISLARVLDLRDGHGLEGFGLDSDALIQEDWTHTQALGHAAYRYLECAGILAPSARHAGSNLIVYLGGMTGNDGLSEPVPMPNGPVELP